MHPVIDSLEMNPLLNGCYEHVPDDADQSITAAASFGVVGALVALGTTGAGTVSRQAFTLGQTDVPGDPRHFLRWNQTTAATAGTPQFAHKIEDVRTFAGRKVTLQGFYRSNQPIPLRMRQDFGSGGSPSADVNVAASGNLGTLPVTTDANGTVQWRAFSISFNLPSLAGKTIGTTDFTSYLAVDFLPPISLLFQLDVTMLRLVPGGLANPTWRRRPHAMEENTLSRYYWSASVQAQNAAFHVGFPRRMRVAPTLATDVGTVDTATVDGFTLTHNAEAAAAITADARIAN